MALDKMRADGRTEDNAGHSDFASRSARPFDRGSSNRPPSGGASILIPPERDGYVFRGSELRSILNHDKKLIDDLEQAMTVLPHVGKDGSSECPFAGELYAKKEEIEQQVKDAVKRLQDYDADLARELQRLKGNQTRIQADADRLNLSETQEHYHEADTLAQKEYRELVQDRDAIAVIMGKALSVLKVSQRRKMPGSAPHKPSPTAFGPPSPSQPSHPMLGPAPLGKGLDGLISLGPLGQTQGQRPYGQSGTHK